MLLRSSIDFLPLPSPAPQPCYWPRIVRARVIPGVFFVATSIELGNGRGARAAGSITVTTSVSAVVSSSWSSSSFCMGSSGGKGIHANPRCRSGIRAQSLSCFERSCVDPIIPECGHRVRFHHVYIGDLPTLKTVRPTCWRKSAAPALRAVRAILRLCHRPCAEDH